LPGRYPVMRDGQEGPAERVQPGPGRGAGVRDGLLGGAARGRAKHASYALLVPGRPPARPLAERRQVPADVAGHVWVLARIEQQGIVAVPGVLMPRVEDGLVVAVVRVQGSHHPTDRIVEQDRADAGGAGEFEAWLGAEERLVVTERGSPVFVDGTDAADTPVLGR